MRHRKPVFYELKRRKFEGKNDDSKNGDSLTSKYMPSYKYWMRIHYKDGGNSTNCYRTKKDALEAYETARRKAGSLI